MLSLLWSPHRTVKARVYHCVGAQERDHEIATLKSAQPDEGDPHADNVKKSKEQGLRFKVCFLSSG